MKIGIVINPIAGVGADLAWKGSDIIEQAWNAVENGANQPVWNIINRAFSSVKQTEKYQWITTDSDSYNFPITYDKTKRSTPETTKEATRYMVNKAVDLIVFFGGDGTARDIAAESKNIPVIGIPAGVKIFSSCFLHRPEEFGNFLDSWIRETTQTDLLDLDEELYKKGIAQSKLFGEITIPVTSLLQSGKFNIVDTNNSFELIAERIKDENMLDNKTIIVGPGSSMKSIFNHLSLDISLLGVDIIKDGKILHLDCDRKMLYNQPIDEIWISPIGKQGHVFGRGNRQIPSDLINKLPKLSIKLFASYDKIQETPTLYVDTGDPNLDEKLKGIYSVIVGYHEEVMRRLI
ncbi:MAG: NAD(+)/NADH kinase [Candidatus Heimdallarchaeota archaeon]|nr:NAD(+)/NADH kinase [Candidatus Heimdallarchaeota archaeon]MDH5646314.1 NAD(+)/NADH kinase [Candidatus Heimdallarchaeota archaeon]